MKIEVLDKPNNNVVEFLSNKIDEFNRARWEIKEKFPLVIQVTNDNKEIVAGACAKTFGLWLLIDILWVSDELRGQNMGSKILAELEKKALERGCKFALLDTLSFQARPFYEKHGYTVKWTQENYPREGSKFFMAKDLK